MKSVRPRLGQTSRQGWVFLAAFSRLSWLLAVGAEPGSPRPTGAPIGFQCGVLPISSVHRLDAARAKPRTTGIQRVLFLRIRFPDDREDPISFVEAESTLATADAWFRRISFGAFGFTFTVSPVLPLATPRTAYAGPGGFDRFLDDARQAGIDAGFDYRQYDLEIVRHSGVDGFAGGNARLGERGAQVQIPGAWVLMHELGHNLGLSHANFWDTSAPGFSFGSPPLPSNYLSLPDPKTIPTHPESAAGHDTVTGPGNPIEYGDPWDIMGSGDDDFHGAYKEYLGWLPAAAQIFVPPGQNTYRIYGGTSTHHPPDAFPRQMTMPGPRNGPAGERHYTAELPTLRNNTLPSSGILVRWIDSSQGRGSSLLLDGTPASPNFNADAIVPLGRTFSDHISGVHLTPIAQGIENGDPWVDVVAVRGHFPSNAFPRVTLTANSLHAAPGEPVLLTASAKDPDGDALAFSWDFSDGKPVTAGSTSRVTRSWPEPGDYAVQLEVSDMRGGVTHAQIAIRIGAPDTRRVQGRVIDGLGNPVPGVRVYSGPRNPERPAGPLAQASTDATGTYILTGLPPGRHTISAFHADYLLPRKPSVIIESTDLADFNFVATEIPRVSVQAPASIPEPNGFTPLFSIHRTGPTTNPLTVLFRLGGTASASTDYVRPLTDRVVIPAGSATTTLGFPILDDTAAEPSETISLTIANPVQFPRTDARGNPFFVYFPGWELTDIEGTNQWVQTRPDYVPNAAAETEILILDDDTTISQTVSITASSLVALEEPLVESSFQLSRSGALEQPLTVHLDVSGSAQSGTDFEALPNVLQFAPSEASILIPVRPVADGIEEPNEEIRLGIRPDPAYGIELAVATVEIRDRLIYPQTLGLAPRTDGLLELRLRGAPGSRLVLEASPDLSLWTPVRTNLLFNSDTATVIVPRSAAAQFYRTVRN